MKTILRPHGENPFWIDAVRDIVVVIVGILAALWLESWWQERQDRAEETVLLTGLREEFLSNRDQLLECMEIWQAQSTNVEIVRSFMGRPLDASRIDEFTAAVQGSFGFRFYDPRSGQLSSMINSGKLGLVENPALRARIADWPSLVDDMNVERAAAMNIFFEGYNQSIRQYLAGSSVGFERRYDEFLQDRLIYAELGDITRNNDRLIREGNVILEATDEIVALIDERLAE